VTQSNGFGVYDTCVKSSGWLADSRLIYTFVTRPNIFTYSQSVRILNPASGATLVSQPYATWPESASFSPSGAHVLWTEPSGRIRIADVTTGVVTTVAPACTFPATCEQPATWLPSSDAILAVREGALWRITLGTGSMIRLHASAGIERLAVSKDGALAAYVEHDTLFVGHLNAVSFGPRRLLAPTGVASIFYRVAWSPSGKSIAFLDYTTLKAINADGTGLRVLSQTSTNGGVYWSR
jgi:hypothetical protein